jgi:hypothetical protein
MYASVQFAMGDLSGGISPFLGAFGETMKRNHGRRCARSVSRAVAVTAPVALLILAGCGGGSDKKWWNQDKSEAPKSSIRVDGQSATVAGVDGKVDVLLISHASADLSTMSGVMGRMKTDELKEAAPGAYVGFGDRRSLLSGTVADLSGDGSYAIGKWTDGSDSSGATYNRNQARFWAVGRPVDVELKAGAVMRCTLASKTQLAAADGNTAPGTLFDASAEIQRVSEKESAQMTLSLRYSIGQDQQTVKLTSTPGGYTSRHREESRNGEQRSERYAVASRFIGRDPLRPYLATSYTLHSPTAGVISGMAVLSCS